MAQGVGSPWNFRWPVSLVEAVSQEPWQGTLKYLAEVSARLSVTRKGRVGASRCLLIESGALQNTELKFDLVSPVNELAKQIRMEFDFLHEAETMDAVGEHLMVSHCRLHPSFP